MNEINNNLCIQYLLKKKKKKGPVLISCFYTTRTRIQCARGKHYHAAFWVPRTLSNRTLP